MAMMGLVTNRAGQRFLRLSKLLELLKNKTLRLTQPCPLISKKKMFLRKWPLRPEMGWKLSCAIVRHGFELCSIHFEVQSEVSVQSLNYSYYL